MKLTPISGPYLNELKLRVFYPGLGGVPGQWLQNVPFDSSVAIDPDIGSGRPVVYLHGYAPFNPQPVASFYGFAQDLTHLSGHIVLAIDENPPANNPLYEAAIATILNIDKINELAITQNLPWANRIASVAKVALIGHSRGGGQAMRLSSETSPVADRIACTVAYAPRFADCAALYCPASNLYGFCVSTAQCTVSNPSPMSRRVVPPVLMMTDYYDGLRQGVDWSESVLNFDQNYYYDRLKVHITYGTNSTWPWSHNAFFFPRSGVGTPEDPVTLAFNNEATDQWVQYWERGTTPGDPGAVPPIPAQIGQQGTLDSVIGQAARALVFPGGYVRSIDIGVVQPQLSVERVPGSPPGQFEYQHRLVISKAPAGKSNSIGCIYTVLTSTPLPIPLDVLPTLGIRDYLRLSNFAIGIPFVLGQNDTYHAFSITGPANTGDLWVQAYAFGDDQRFPPNTSVPSNSYCFSNLNVVRP